MNAGHPGRTTLWWVLVAACCVGGFLLRVWNVDWDDRQHLHPDERHWAMTSAALAEAPRPDEHGTIAGPLLDWLDGQRSPANPYRGTESFVYGPITLAAGRGVAGWLEGGADDGDQPAAAVVELLDVLGAPLLDDAGAARFDSAYNVDLVGRLLGAVADVATIAVVALIGRRLGGRRAGVLAAFFAATLVLSIQHAHFFGAEPALGLASALTVLALLRLDRGSGMAAACRSGLVVGLAAGAVLAAKVSGAGLVLVPFGLSAALVVMRRRRADVARLVAVAVGALTSFRVLCPPAFRGLGLWPNSQFWDDLRRQREAAAADMPPSMQWADRLPLYDGTRWLVEFTVGPGASIAAVTGMVLLVRHRHRIGRWPPAVAVSCVLVPYCFVLSGVVTSGRYFVPMMPALCACAGYAVAAGLRRRQTIVSGALIGMAALWALAFVAGVHGHEHTRIAATEWIAERVAPGAVLSLETWDDGLPLALGGVSSADYAYEQFDLWGVDNVDKTRTLADQLQRVDYVVESSPRVWNTVTRNPGRYPSTIRFFEALDDGSLGFERVATFTSPPRLGPFVLDSSSAEEAFSVYDHPEVRIWQKVDSLAADELFARLDPLAASRAMPISFDHASTDAAMLSADERRANEGVGTFAAAFDVGGSGVLHAIGWFVILEIVGWSTFVVFLPLLRRLPDAGAGLSKALGLVVVTFAVFVAVTRVGVPLGRGVMAAVVASWVLAGASVSWRRRRALAEVVGERRRALVHVEVLTIAAFVGLLVLRAANPDVWHASRSGEKPFELEMFTSVLRSRTLPPYDAWFADGALNYYYAGYLMLSIPARLVRTAPTTAMNLAVGAIGALAVGAVYSAGAACVRGDDGRRGGLRARRAGLIAVLFVLVLPSVAIIPRVARRLVGLEHGAIDWWSMSRVIPDSLAVTEFPAWSLLFADVHPHLIDLAVVATVLAVSIAFHGALRDGPARHAVALGAVAGMLVGAVRAVNTWDLPLAALLVGAALVIAVVQERSLWRRAGAAALAAAATMLVGWGPYVARSEVTDSSVELNSRHTPLGSWAWQFGFFAAVTVVALATTIPRSWFTFRRVAVLAAGVAGVAVLAVTTEWATLLVSVALAAAGAVVAARGRHPIVGLVTAAGWGVLAVVEVVSVVNDTDRMNTVFKGWFQAWLLLAVAAAGAVAVLVGTTRPWWRRAVASSALVVAGLMVVSFVKLAVPARLDDRTSTSGASLDGSAFFSAPAERLALVDPDDTDAAEGFSPADDLPLIRWLQDHVEGIVTVAEAPGFDYTWRSRISVFTGLPTVIGWPYHETQQRRNYGAVIDDREVAMNDLYASASSRRIHEVLQRFDIRYVVFGTVERVIAGERGRAALLASPCLMVEVEHDDLFVAAVDQTCVAEQRGSLPVWSGLTAS